MSRRPPREPSTRMASPWPTSRMEIRAIPAGRAITTEPVTARLRSSAATLARRSRRFVLDVLGAAPAGRADVVVGGALAGIDGLVGSVTPARRRRRHHVTPAIPATDSAAAAVSRGGWSVTLANGRLAAVSTMVTSNRRTTQPGAATTAPRTGGAPATTATPPARASTPTAIAGATSGTTSRLTSGDSTASRPNETRMIGRVAACAASETPRLSASQPGHPSAAETPEPLGERCRPGDQTGRRERRELEPGIADERRVGDEQDGGGPGEGGGRTAGSPALARQEDDARHQRRADHRGGRAGERDIEHDRDDRHDRPAATSQAARHRADGRRDDRDVPTRDGDDVTDAGRGEGRGEVAIDQVPQADEDPGGQSRLRLRQDARQREGRATPQQLEAPAGTVGRRPDRQRPRRERAHGTDPEQVFAVGRVRPRADRAVDGDQVAGRDDRIGRQGRRDRERRHRIRCRRERRTLMPVARRAGGLDDEPPRSVAVGNGRERRRPCRNDGQADRDEPGAAGDGQQRPRPEPWSRFRDEQDRRGRQRDRSPEVTRRDLSGSDRGRDRTECEAAAPAHLRAPSRGP